ncbi:MAG: hypothetical protein M3409_09050 [Gemmatimonadota bacterium]|nr:hypothetical protein [Gemmatimonadota bacterium]
MSTPQPGERKEVGGQASSQRHPPHVSENAEEAPVQEEVAPGGEPVPTLGANAHGVDKVSTDEMDLPVDDESMYDRRPSEDKDQPPSETGKP